MKKLPYEAKITPPDDEHPGWQVSAVGDDGEMYETSFDFHDAEHRAREYAEAAFERVSPDLGHWPRAATDEPFAGKAIPQTPVARARP